MQSANYYLFVADFILFIHVAIVVFIIAGQLLITAGKWLAWDWVRNPWFRLVHVMSIGVVLLQSWLGVICPLTIWEAAFRSRAGEAAYEGSFVSYWVSRMLFYEAPAWVFVVCYTAFGCWVGFSWFWVRPRGFGSKHSP